MTTEKELKKLKIQVNDLYLRVNKDGTYHFAYMQRGRFSDTLVELDSQCPVLSNERDSYLKVIERTEGLDQFGSSHRLNSEIYRYVLNTSADRLEDLAHSFYAECDPGKVVKGGTLLKLEKQLQVSDRLDAMKISRMNSSAMTACLDSIFSHRHTDVNTTTVTENTTDSTCME